MLQGTLLCTWYSGGNPRGWRSHQMRPDLPSLRRPTFITYDTALRPGALARGESLPMIRKLLGHRQVQTTAQYAYLKRQSVKALARRIVQPCRRYGDVSERFLRHVIYVRRTPVIFPLVVSLA